MFLNAVCDKAVFSMSKSHVEAGSVLCQPVSVRPGSITLLEHHVSEVVDLCRDDHVIPDPGDSKCAFMAIWLWSDTKHVESFLDGAMLRRDPKAVADVMGIGTCWRYRHLAEVNAYESTCVQTTTTTISHYTLVQKVSAQKVKSTVVGYLQDAG